MYFLARNAPPPCCDCTDVFVHVWTSLWAIRYIWLSRKKSKKIFIYCWVKETKSFWFIPNQLWTTLPFFLLVGHCLSRKDLQMLWTKRTIFETVPLNIWNLGRVGTFNKQTRMTQTQQKWLVYGGFAGFKLIAYFAKMIFVITNFLIANFLITRVSN